MKFLSTSAAGIAATLLLVACGGGSTNSATSAGASTTVGVKSVDGVGKVLVDSKGKTLYASDVEADGTVRCLGACNSFWMPLTTQTAAPKAAPGAGKLGVVRRPDGTRQITANGKLLYTFSEDGVGSVKGNGFSDDFGGRHFTWNAVVASGGVAGGGSSGSGSGY